MIACFKIIQNKSIKQLYKYSKTIEMQWRSTKSGVLCGFFLLCSVINKENHWKNIVAINFDELMAICLNHFRLYDL